MSAEIIQFPMAPPIQSPWTARQIRHQRMAELLVQRARRKGITASIEDARASVTRAILESMQ